MATSPCTETSPPFLGGMPYPAGVVPVSEADTQQAEHVPCRGAADKAEGFAL
jgi:hypothetical protein